MNQAVSRLFELSSSSAPALSPDATETDVISARGGGPLRPPSFVPSLQCWLVFGGAALPAIKLAERCGHIPPPGVFIELLASLLLIVTVGISLVVVYRRQSRMTLAQALVRSLVFPLLGAAAAALIHSCQA